MIEGEGQNEKGEDRWILWIEMASGGGGIVDIGGRRKGTKGREREFLWKARSRFRCLYS